MSEFNPDYAFKIYKLTQGNLDLYFETEEVMDEYIEEEIPRGKTITTKEIFVMKEIDWNK